MVSKNACFCCTAGGQQQKHHRPAVEKGLERYSQQDEGALYTLGWVDLEDPDQVHWCPMHEEPLHLIPNRSARKCKIG